MYNETTLMVNVDATSKKLSDTAVNLWIANEVVLELDQPDAPDVESGKSFYAQMTKKVLSDGAQGVTDGYYFTFDTGDVFFSATANGYPELVGDTLNIGTDNGGGSGGGSPLIVQCTFSNGEYVLSEDWDTINEAFTEDGRPVLIELTDSGTKSVVERHTYCLVTEVQSAENASEAKSASGTGYVVVCTNLSNVDFNFKYIFYSDTSSGTLSCSEPLPIDGGGSGGGPLIVHSIVDGDTHTLDKTFQEIYDALSFVVLEGGEGGGMFGYSYGYPLVIGYDGETYRLIVNIYGMSPEYVTDSVDGYPSYTNAH